MLKERTSVGSHTEERADSRVVERSYPDLVASGEKSPVSWVPDDEGEVAEEAFRATLSPLQVRRQDQIGVFRRARKVGGQRVEQLLAIVQPGDRGEDQAGRMGFAGSAASLYGRFPLREVDKNPEAVHG